MGSPVTITLRSTGMGAGRSVCGVSMPYCSKGSSRRASLVRISRLRPSQTPGLAAMSEKLSTR